ncbi:alpha/beta fold hydrolase [Blastococcus montanus]|uniref:esterase/lipase family protein n=1 Tax=Blastococcus montanus TaxID=3144973 RepID=UPI0032088264
MLVTAALSAMLVLTGSAGLATAAPGSACLDPRTPTPAAPQVSDARPVVLVHGWTGKPLTELAGRIEGRLDGHIATYLFDYGKYSSYWANNGHIAACLAEFVRAVSQVSGGQRVIVVAHSMGGIATRYAFMSRYASPPLTAAHVGAVVTLATPWTGSPFGGTNWAKAKEAFLSGGADLPNIFTGTGDGGFCLGVHLETQKLADGDEGGCGSVPAYFPAGVQLTSIAGDVTVERTAFGHTLYTLPLGGDGIVDRSSAQGYLFSGPDRRPPAGQTDLTNGITPCRVTTDTWYQLGLGALVVPWLDNAGLDDVGTGTISPTGVAPYLLATVAASCGHVKIVEHGPALDEVVAAVRVADTRLDAGYTGPSTLSLTGFAGKFDWGDTRAVAEAALGQQFTTVDMGGGCLQATLPGLPAVTFGILGGEVTVGAALGGSASGPTPATDTGLRLGDPVTRLLADYPAVAADADPIDAMTTRFTEIRDGMQAQFFSSDGQTVDAMQFGRSGSVGEAPCV